MKVDETTISECDPTKIVISKATSFLCVCVLTSVGGLLRISVNLIAELHRGVSSTNGSILFALVFKFSIFCSGMHENPTVYSLANSFYVSMRGCISSCSGFAVKLFSGAMQIRQARHSENSGIIDNSGHER